MLSSVIGKEHFTPKKSPISLVKIFLYSKKNPSKVRRKPFYVRRMSTLCDGGEFVQEGSELGR